MKGNLFQGLLTLARGNKDVIRDAATSAALTTGLGMLSGDPGMALQYGAADFLASYPATLAVRGLRPKGQRQIKDLTTGKVTTEQMRSKLELPVNIGASVLAGMGVSAMTTPPTPTELSQPQQILQQNIQRDLINQGVLAGGSPHAFFPDTMFQAQGMEHLYMRDLMQQGLMPPNLDMAGIGREMGAIVGV
jgi:hypothetical protein